MTLFTSLKKMKSIVALCKVFLGCFLLTICVFIIIQGQSVDKGDGAKDGDWVMQKTSHPPYFLIYLFQSVGCHFCEEEKDVINKLYKEYKDKIIFIGITEGYEDKDLEKIYLQETGLNFAYIIPDPDFHRWKRLNIFTFPAKLIMDISGRILFLETDLYLPDRPEGREGIKRLHAFLEEL